MVGIEGSGGNVGFGKDGCVVGNIGCGSEGKFGNVGKVAIAIDDELLAQHSWTKILSK
ncbi:hypothetical protein Patl1_25835 [Pistacia atlantica]|uniref:Uncharacterized protein n=1 Tax=Pistacia atlantica TaxID=434234 RepID=A0ACC1B3Q5_9ROSI|nr:hypothetical protein Patl1_25835 [Pistacia atlantica]